MNDTQRLVAVVEDLTAELEQTNRELQKAVDAIAHDEYEPPEQADVSERPVTESASYAATLQRHMTKHDVPTHLVTVKDTDNYGDQVYFEEQFSEMTDDQVQAFREYTMNQDHVDVHQWVEHNENNYPDGFVVEYSDIEELRA